jgi:MHS family proline/betaine transporter-like MFS transporter
VTLFGGFATFTITWLIANTGSNVAPAFYIMFAATISACGAFLYRDRNASARVTFKGAALQ